MRAWFSVPIVKGVRTGISVNPNSLFGSSDPFQFVSASGRKFWRIFAAAMWFSFAVWLIASRDYDGRISEWWLIVLAMVMATHYLFKRSLWLLFPLREIDPAAQPAEQRGEPVEQRYNSFGEPIETPTPARPAQCAAEHQRRRVT